jgi:hypothetical protein
VIFRLRFARHQTVVATVFRQAEFVLVGKPGQLRGKLLALALRRVDRHAEAAGIYGLHIAFDAAEMIDIGNHALIGTRAALTGHIHVAGRHIDDQALEFLVIGKHQAALHINGHALKCTLFKARRSPLRLSLRECVH